MADGHANIALSIGLIFLILIRNPRNNYIRLLGETYNLDKINLYIDNYKIKTNYLEYPNLISAVAHYKKVYSTACHYATPEDLVDRLLHYAKVSKKIYACLINKNEASMPSRSQGKWLEERDLLCNPNTTVNWKCTYCLPFLCTRKSKLRVFHK